jgi:hypothetical protein
LETQILIDNQPTSRVKFCSFDLLGVLATNYSPQVVVNCWESPCQTYKSPSQRFCSPANGSLLPNIQLVLGILHWWASFLFFRQQGTSLKLEEFDKPCLLSFSKWNKIIESGKLVQITHSTIKKIGCYW